jgi:flagellin-like protein
MVGIDRGLIEEDRAVSPVIGVILMVAIAVILAAVIGAFVLEIGDRQEVAPSMSLQAQERVEFVSMMPGGCHRAPTGDTIRKNCGNTSRVYIKNTGGDNLDVHQTRITVEGNGSVFGLNQESSSDQGARAGPMPNTWETLGTNQPAEFTAGESWNILF